MIESVFGSLLKEKILVYITVNPESYPNEISRVFQSSLSSVQKHLENLEKNGIVVSRLKGKTRLYDLNPRSPFKKELTALLEKIYSFINENEKEKFFVRGSRPRRKGKPL
ncbi:MAG: ArsR family transcriptional regulator [Chrysiogenales bacterium]|nr:MAG: ArsR family transcriptional regulator [Chrysiogenales bacterium]